MMKVMRGLFCQCLIVFALSGNAFGQKPFQSTFYGYSPDYYDKEILALKNGGFLAIEGLDVSVDNKKIITKFDACHNRQWCKEFENTVNAYENNIIASSDNGFFVGSYSANDNNQWPVITKLNKDGNIDWCKKLFLDLPPIAVWFHGGTNLLATSNGGCIIAGTAQKLTPTGTKNFTTITKLDNNGNIEWTKKYEQPAYPFLVEIVAMPNEGFCLLLRVGVAGDIYPYIMNIDKNGDLVWLRKIYRPSLFISHDFNIETSISDVSGNIYAAGDFFSQSITNDVSFILKIDKTGKPSWLSYLEYSYSSSYNGITNLALSKDGNIVFTGNQSAKGFEYIGSITPDAKLLWLREDLNKNSFNTNGNQGNNLQTTEDSGYISIKNNYFNFSNIIKYDKDGKLGCNQKDTT